jgi:hypothetical protein
MAVATAPSASSQPMRVNPGSPRRRRIGCVSRPRSRSSRFAIGSRAATSVSTSGSAPPWVLIFSSFRRVVHRCTPSMVQSWNPATPSAQPSHTPFDSTFQAYGRFWRFSPTTLAISR